MPEPLAFDLAAVESDAGPVVRARETDGVVRAVEHGGPFIVAFADSEHVHEVELVRDGDEWRGDCWAVDDDGERFRRCRGLAFNGDDPCAHLWRVHSDACGGRVSVRDLADERTESQVDRARHMERPRGDLL